MAKEKHLRIKNLKCYKEVDIKIKSNVAVEVIAEWIQTEMLEATDITRGGLEKALYRYKADLPPTEIVREPPLYLKKTIEKIKRGVDEFSELEGLYLLQLKRISIDVQTEEKINKLFSGTSREIELATKLLAQMVDLKQKLGFIAPSEQKVVVEHSGGVAVANADLTLGRLDEEQKIKLGMLSEKLLSSVLGDVAPVAQAVVPSEEDELSESISEQPIDEDL